MSAIFGIVNLDGRPVDPEDFDRMGLALSHRGPDGSSAWVDGPVALGVQIMHITPESLYEKVPYGTGTLHITATARLDNREALSETLGIPPSEHNTISDSRLILHAYEQWGEACPEHLLGDFAFMIWDRERRKLVCATDHMGVRPLFYTGTSQRFIFASEIKGILAVPDVPVRLNARKLSEYSFLIARYDFETTFYEDIYQLPKATMVTADTDGIRKRVYWKSTPAEDLHCRSDAEWLEALKALVFQAMEARLRSARPVVALLSGGMDSSSIVAVTARILEKRGQSLTVLAAVNPDGISTGSRDERYFIDQFRTWDNVNIEYIVDEWRGPFDDLERLI